MQLTIILAALAATVAAGPIGFSYEVPNSHSHTQTSENGVVNGSFSITENGVTRTINYSAGVHGFVVESLSEVTHHEGTTTEVQDEGTTDNSSYVTEHVTEGGDDGSYHVARGLDGEDGSYSPQENNEVTHHEETTTDVHDEGTADNGSYVTEHITEGGDDGSYHVARGLDGEDGSYNPQENDEATVGNDHDGQYRASNDNHDDDDGQYRPSNENHGDDGQYRALNDNNDDDGQYRASNENHGDDGQYRVLDEHNGDNGQYHPDLVV